MRRSVHKLQAHGGYHNAFWIERMTCCHDGRQQQCRLRTVHQNRRMMRPVAVPWMAQCACSLTTMTRQQQARTFHVGRYQQMAAAAAATDAMKRDRQTVQQDHDYCVKLVQERDREAYLGGLLIPSAIRPAYFALRAFNVELATIKDQHHVRQQRPSGGDMSTHFALQMRIQWWRDAVAEIYQEHAASCGDGNGTESSSRQVDPHLRSLSISAWHSPVVRAVARTQQHYGLTRPFMDRLIDAREQDLNIVQYDSLDQAVAYAEDSVASLLYLNLDIVQVRDDAVADHVAQQAGIGIGMTTLLRGVPFRLAHQEMPIPASLLRPHFPYSQLLRQEDDADAILTEADGQLWHDAVQTVALQAQECLQTARDRQGQLPKAARPVLLLPMVPSWHYLHQLQRCNFNVLDGRLRHDAARLSLLGRLGRTWLTGVL